MLWAKPQRMKTGTPRRRGSILPLRANSEDLGGWLDAVGLGIGDEPCGEETAHDITQEDDSEHRPVTLETDEACCARIELQTVIDNGGESEGEEDGTCHASYTEIDHRRRGRHLPRLLHGD